MKRANDDAGWFTLSQMCEVFGVQRAAFHQTYRPLVPSDGLRQHKKRGLLIHGRKLIDAWVNHKLVQQRSAADGDDALIYAGSDSPNLERLRATKATLAEMDLEERRGTHADLGELHAAIVRYGGQVRRAGEVLQRKFGSEAADILNEAIDTASNEWKRNSGSPDGTDVGQGAPSGDGGADPKAVRGVAGAAAANDPKVRRGRNRSSDRPAPG